MPPICDPLTVSRYLRELSGRVVVLPSVLEPPLATVVLFSPFFFSRWTACCRFFPPVSDSPSSSFFVGSARARCWVALLLENSPFRCLPLYTLFFLAALLARACSSLSPSPPLPSDSYLQDLPGRVAVLPSLLENSPYGVLECLALRIPFLCSDVGGVPELIHPGQSIRGMSDRIGRRVM